MTKKEKQLQQTISRKCRFCLVASLSLVLAASMGKIIFSNRLATVGGDLEKLKTEASNIRQENQLLKNELTNKTGGLIEINQQALSQGWTDKPQVKYLNHEWKLAFKSN